MAGNQNRYLYDFSPDAVVFRWTDDFAPRMLYGFSLDGENRLTISEIVGRIEQGNIDPAEVIIGMSTSTTLSPETQVSLKEKEVEVLGVKAAAEEIKNRARKAHGPLWRNVLMKSWAPPDFLRRFGGLSLGESTHLVHELRLSRPSDPLQEQILVSDIQGNLALPIWPDHVGSSTYWGQYRLFETSFETNPCEETWMTICRPKQ